MNTREQIESLLGKFVVITFPNFVPRKDAPHHPVFYRRVAAINAWYDQGRAMMCGEYVVALDVPISTHGYAPHNAGVDEQKYVRFTKSADLSGEWRGGFVIDDRLEVCLKLVPTAS